MKIEKTIVIVYEPVWCKVDFNRYCASWNMKKPNMKCFRCDKPFGLEHTVSLVGMKRRPNEVACLDCGEAIRDRLRYEFKYGEKS